MIKYKIGDSVQILPIEKSGEVVHIHYDDRNEPIYTVLFHAAGYHHHLCREVELCLKVH